MSAEAKHALQFAAAQLGFSGVGVAAPEADQGAKLQNWLQAGMHADMAWMERHLEARLNPDKVLPGVRSIIILTYEYPRRDARQASGSIARYAQGEDYHKLLAGKLADLDETLAFYGGQQRCFSDSGPVSERFFAEQAGLGWIGRHGLLVRPGKGSYCFLSSILTTLELPRDTPMKNHCGNCHRCEQACPTGALINGCCDARKCISFWTIESKAQEIPAEIRAAMGSRMYGCDACQEACPWNRPQQEVRVDPHLLMPAELQQQSLPQLAALPAEDFNALFTGSPIRRIGIEHLQMNIRALPQQES